jgi:hypothetical protein
MLRLWYSSKDSLSPSIISYATSLFGSSTVIFWNLLSKAESFSIYFLYSFPVVAQITLIFHLPIAGLRILDASKLHSQLPAPIIVCISSIKRMISFSTLDASSITCLILDSNSHLYFVPATSEDISRASTFLFLIEKGTWPFAILSASHSAIAVLPTQGSHTSTGLFFVFLFSIAMSLSISSSLHIIFSILFSLASFVRSTEKKSRAGVVESSFFSCFLFLSKGVDGSQTHQKRFCERVHKSPSISSHQDICCIELFSQLFPSITQSLFISVIFPSRSVGAIQM